MLVNAETLQQAPYTQKEAFADFQPQDCLIPWQEKCEDVTDDGQEEGQFLQTQREIITCQDELWKRPNSILTGHLMLMRYKVKRKEILAKLPPGLKSLSRSLSFTWAKDIFLSLRLLLACGRVFQFSVINEDILQYWVALHHWCRVKKKIAGLVRFFYSQHYPSGCIPHGPSSFVFCCISRRGLMLTS